MELGAEGMAGGEERRDIGSCFPRKYHSTPPTSRPDMSPLPLTILLTSVVLGSAQEAKRSSRVRFPNEQQQHNNGPQVYESESQVVPIIISAGANGLVNGPHYVIPKVPSVKNPFGDISAKGYAEGVIIPHVNHHPAAQQQEFHQTVPPPKTLLAGHPQSFVLMRQQGPNQGWPALQQQQNTQLQKAHQEHLDRHRFSIPPRLPYRLVKPDPSQGAFHQIYASGMAYTKDAQKHPDVATYRYSIVDNHGKPRPSHPDEFEMEINHGIPDELMSPLSGENQWSAEFSNNNGQHFTTQKATQKPKDSNKFPDFPDFDQGFHEWPIKSTYRDIISQSNRFHNKNKKGNKQSTEKFPIPNINHNEDFSGYDDFPDFPNSPNQNNKRFSYQRKPEFERGPGKLSYKPAREQSSHETKHKKTPPKFAPTASFETIKSIELAGGEIFSDENISPSYDYQPFKKQQKPQINYNSQQHFTKTNLKKPQKQQNHEDIKFSFNFPQRPDRVKKPHKQSNFDFAFDFPNSKPLKKQHKQHRTQQNNGESDYLKYHSQQDESQQGGGSYGSDWIPINAPEGVVPAKSYEIPAPDLSRGFYNEKLKRPYIKDWHHQQEDDEDYNRFKSSETDTVYGVQKGHSSGGHSGGHSGEEVVSATFRVKQ